MKPAVTVIVPIYNAEKELSRCLQSLSEQTLKEMQILLVVDAESSMQSMETAEEFTCKDPRMSLIKTNAHGASSVRNAGIRNASGEYIGFVDSDDYILPDMFQDLYRFARENGLDVVVSGMMRQTALDVPPQTLMQYPQEITRFSDMCRKKFMYRYVLSSQANPVCNKLYRAEIIHSNNQLFYENIAMGEDAAFNAECFSKADSAGSVDSAYYIYYKRPDSISHVIDTLKTLDDFRFRWDIFIKCAKDIPDGDKMLAVAALRLTANAMLFVKYRNGSAEEACRFCVGLIDYLDFKKHLQTALLPGVLAEYAEACHMGNEALANFRKFAESLKNEEEMLKWQLHYTDTAGKKASS